MSAPLRRNRDPQPLARGWEVAFVVVAAVLAAVVLAALAGVGLAAVCWGGGWVWPSTGEEISNAVRGLLAGRPDDGYPPLRASRLAPPAATYAAVAVSEAVILTATLLSAVYGYRRFGSGGARSGFATRHEAERALGVAQLRSARSVIRPDLHRR